MSFTSSITGSSFSCWSRSSSRSSSRRSSSSMAIVAVVVLVVVVAVWQSAITIKNVSLLLNPAMSFWPTRVSYYSLVTFCETHDWVVVELHWFANKWFQKLRIPGTTVASNERSHHCMNKSSNCLFFALLCSRPNAFLSWLAIRSYDTSCIDIHMSGRYWCQLYR